MATMGSMRPARMPVQTASAVTFFYALGYPVGNLAVASMSPMAVLAFRFGLAATILGIWTSLAGVRWPTGRNRGGWCQGAWCAWRRVANSWRPCSAAAAAPTAGC